ncbi:conserved hypothetical protein [Mesorhizobium sp. ORS 3324]|nr:conserved hypothetical protein [Mesorhizobium sp. ORS 3324]
MNGEWLMAISEESTLRAQNLLMMTIHHSPFTIHFSVPNAWFHRYDKPWRFSNSPLSCFSSPSR